jgi:hypothetical protein
MVVLVSPWRAATSSAIEVTFPDFFLNVVIFMWSYGYTVFVDSDQHNTFRSPTRKNQVMGKSKSAERAQNALMDFAKSFEVENLQEMVDMGTSMISAGLGYLDVAANPASDDPTITSEDANNITHGLTWAIIDDLEDDTVSPLNEFLESFVTILLRKVESLSPEQRSNVTIALAKFFGTASAGIIASTLPYDVEAEELDKMADTMAGNAIGSTIQQAVAVAMRQIVEDEKPSTSEESPSSN